MDVSALLAALPDGAGSDTNADLLEARLASGLRLSRLDYLPDGVGPLRAPALLVALGHGDSEEVLVVGLGPRTARLLARASPTSDPARRDESLDAELRALFATSARVSSPEDRAADLMDWILEKLDASRCALIPCEAGVAGPPVAARLRGVSRADLNPRKVPRAIVEHVMTTRQPLASRSIADDAALPASVTSERQSVRSCIAVPVVFHGELLAACYLDRFQDPRDFSEHEVRMFEAIAYELARPLLEIREACRRDEYAALRDAMLARGDGVGLATSPALLRLLDRARPLAAHADVPLLLLGETGVGKERVARWIHEQGGARGPFVAVNVAAIPAELFEAEICGTAKGAFTGAVDRPGRLAQSAGGTLFLDEIGDLPLPQQVQLLRILQDRTVTPVGGTRSERVDARIIAATNRSIESLVRAGEFRADVLHRFAPPLVVPPLRERGEEILPHARAWIAAQSRRRGMPCPELSPDAEALLVRESWPGNVRQLEMLLSNAVVMASRRTIDAELLRSLLGEAAGSATIEGAPSSWDEWRRVRDEQEKAWVIAVLAAGGGVVDAAARKAGCPASTLRHLVGKHDLGGRGRRGGDGSEGG